MSRRKTARETCDANGWEAGTILRGHESWGAGKLGAWTTIRITAVGESTILARCIRHELTSDGEVIEDRDCNDREGTWTLDLRDWAEVQS